MAGKFIVFEGIDGSGKTTQSKLLKKSLTEQGFFVILTKEPTNNSSVSQKIRKILNKEIVVSPKELQELFIQDRKEHLDNFVIPNLTEGKIVISDRYYFSTIAYGLLGDISIEWLINKNKKFLIPELVFILDVNPEVCIKRMQTNRESMDLFEKIEKLKQISQNYKNLSKYFDNLIFISGNREVSLIHSDIQKICEKFLEKTSGLGQ